jgi:uridine phosphorylase
MARTKKQTCNVTGVTTSTNNFYNNQTHVKAVDNLRRVTGANKDQLKRMFNQLATY